MQIKRLTKNCFVAPVSNARGAVAVMVAITMTVLLAMAAGALDIGHALVAKNELQNAADAGALAGTRRLSQIYQGLAAQGMQTYTMSSSDLADVVSVVQTTGLSNIAAGVSIVINAGDVQVGQWNPATRSLTPTTNLPRAVRVVARRDGRANGPISTFLAKVIGITSVNVTAVATAAVSGISSTNKGDLDAPFGISTYYFTQYGCGSTIKFYPNDGTPQACAAWHAFDQAPASANAIKNIVNGLRTGGYESPATAIGDSLQFTNGNVATVFPNLLNLYNAKQVGGAWNVLVPVYESPSCTPPSGAITIRGYATAKVTNVTTSPTNTITATVACDIIDGDKSGGMDYGTFGVIPGLVE